MPLADVYPPQVEERWECKNMNFAEKALMIKFSLLIHFKTQS
jgi:hypothetical protein